MAEKITLQEVARAAKVSLATASRVLNKTGRVSPKIERRVRTALAKLGAAPRAKKTQTLCFVLSNRPMLHPFHAHVLMGAQTFAAENGCNILFNPVQYGPEVPADEIRFPLLLDRSGIVDGYIIGGMNTPNLLGLLSQNHVPMAVLGNNVLGDWRPDEFDVVWIDDIAGAYEMTQYLLGLSHRAIWFFGSRRFPTGRMYEGYRRAMVEAGLQPQSIESDSLAERDSGYIGLKSLLSQKAQVTAVFAHTDAVAHGALEAALASGYSVPRDISIAGYGDRPEAAALMPGLTTVWGYPEHVGRRLAELVFLRLAEPDSDPRHVCVPTRLVKRDSCAAPQSAQSAASPREPKPEASPPLQNY